MKKIVPLALICTMTAIMVSCGNSSSTIIGYIESNDFEKAYNYYVDKIDNSKKQDEIDSQIEEAMDSAYKSIISKYSSGDINDSDLSYIQKLASEASFYSSSEYNDFLYNIGIIDSSSSAYENGMSEFSNGNYSVAISYFKMVDAVDSSHYSEALDKISECEQLLTAQQTDGIQTLIKDGKYQDALREINLLSSTDSALASSLSSELESAVTSDIDTKVDNYFDAFDYNGAYSYLNGLYNDFGFESISKRLNSLEDDFVSYSLASAENDAADKNYEAASAVVQQAIEVVGDGNERLNSAYEDYRSHLPIYIVDMNYMSCVNGVKTQGTLKDNVGNLYHNGLFMCRDISFIGDKGWYGEGSADYYIQGKYESFSGTVAVPSGNESTKCSAYFEVYGDGELLYTSPVMEKTSFPEEFSIDITGVKILKIAYPESNDRADMATIYDGLLQPVADE